MEYCIVCGTGEGDLETVEKDVNAYIVDGWEPIGGVSIQPKTSQSASGAAQAMILRDKPTERLQQHADPIIVDCGNELMEIVHKERVK